MEKQVECAQCNGNYVVRDGINGIFVGCSGYPRCKSTLKIHELAHAVIMKYGLNLYGWKKPCWKCKQDITVYSYFLFYELKEVDTLFRGLHGIGLGDIPCVDHVIRSKYKTITKRYSNTIQRSYVANVCEHCQALQGRYFVVDDPHEITIDLWHEHTMEKYLIENIKVNNPDLLAELNECLDLRLNAIMTPSFSQPEPEPASLADIRSLGEYQPFRDGRNPVFDYESGRLLRFKAGDFGTALRYMRLVMAAEGGLLNSGNVAVCVVPPHRVGACTRDGIGLVAKELCKERPDVVNGRRCLYRHREIKKLSGGGERSLQIHLDSIRVSYQYLIQGRDVLLLDDIATTGFSLCACRLLLLRAGAASVCMFALAKSAGANHPQPDFSRRSITKVVNKTT